MTNQQTESLLRSSSDDELVMLAEVPVRAFGFHAQQAVEKLLKALINQLGHTHGRTHDLLVLIRHLSALGEPIPDLPFDILLLTEFAVTFRYNEPLPITDRAIIIESVRVLREHIPQRIAALRG